MNDAGQVMSGQSDVPAGFDCWILKFDGVTDLELGEPKGFGRIEYAYYLMAQAAGINMMESRLLEENGRAHFITKRFDSVASANEDNKKIHMQSLCGIAHFDFNQAGAYGYEQAFMVMRQLRLSRQEAQQMFRRMVFNVLARNQDDRAKNIAFLMNESGKWKMSPAYDVIYSHNPAGQWTSQHQMSINGKRDNFTKEDLLAVGRSISVAESADVFAEVEAAVGEWQSFASKAGVTDKQINEIAGNHRRL
jgi:serine/threonine-protein kinase HipA